MAASSIVALSESTYKDLLGIRNKLDHLLPRKFNCDIEVKGPKSLTPLSDSEGSVTVYKKTLPNGLRISVQKDDMTRQNADAVVNAANEMLLHGGGLAFALAKAGGPVVTQESKRYISNFGPLQTGSIAVTSGGNLPCKKIIHAVGPQWSSFNRRKSEVQLKEAIKNILKYVKNDNSIRSVAIPAVSSGIFGFPLDECADIIVSTVNQFTLEEKCDHLREVRLVNNDDKTVRAMKKACEQVFQTGDHSRGSLNVVSSYAQQPPSYSHQTSSYPHQSSSYTRHREPSFAQHGQPSISINGLSLHLKKGSIEDQTTDIIVNSISRYSDLSVGSISAAIFRKSGPELQKDIDLAKNEGGVVIRTEGYRLPCQYVFHVKLEESQTRDVKEILHNSIIRCLQMAQEMNLTSISFPSLGTGITGFNEQLVSSIMVGAVRHFAQSNPCRMDIYFVIQYEKNETFKAFEEMFQINQTGNRQISREEQKGSQVVASEETYAIITGQKDEDVRDAETWFKRIIGNSGSLTIKDNHLLMFGIKEHKELMSSRMTNISISEDLQYGIASMSIMSSPRNVLHTAVRLEMMLMSAQEEHAQYMKEELFQAAVQWFYEDAGQTHLYPAKANMDIEIAFMSQRCIDVEFNGNIHRLQFEGMTARDANRTCPLSRNSFVKQDDSPGAQKTNKKLLEMVDWSNEEFTRRAEEFRKVNLEIVKMEKVENKVLTAVYESKKDVMESKAMSLYQRVPGHYRKLICRVGFQRVYQEGDELKYGAGIYFKRNLDSLFQEEPETSDPGSLVYIIEAEVKIGRSTSGIEAYDTPPLVGSDPLDVYDTLTDGSPTPQTFVIFDSYRANPRYVFTCKWKCPVGSSV
ncbi:protein mono-ADP-ribosyltransferase PARP9-like [Discoglossus pictus]